MQYLLGAMLALHFEDIRPEDPHGFDTVVTICDRFPQVVRRLQQRYADRPKLVNDEHDLHDLFAALLAVHFDDVRDEEPTPSHAGAGSRMDHLLKTERIVVESKMARASLSRKDVADELLADIARYEKHPDCDALVCLVYDPDHRITNPRGLERDLESTPSRLRILVLVRS